MTNKKRKATILFDKLIGEPIFSLLKKSNDTKTVINKKKIKNILIVSPGGIGDFLLKIPTFKEINKIFPRSKIDILLFKRNEFCKQFYDNFNKITTIDRPKELTKFILMKKYYDLCIDLDQNRKIPSILSIMSKAKIKIGFNNNGKDVAYNFPVDYHLDKYEAQSFLDLLRPLKIFKSISEKELILVKSKHKIKSSVGIYASAMKEENRLSIEKWKEIITKSGKNREYYLFGSEKDKDHYNLLEKALKDFKIHRREGKSNLIESIKEISKMEKFISEDGGVYHMAVCAGVPTTSYWLHDKANMNKWKAPFRNHKGVLLR